MRTHHLLGVIAVLVLILAIWLVPLALAGDSAPDGSEAAAQPSGTQCPYLQAHPWLDPHGSGGGAGASTGSSSPSVYY